MREEDYIELYINLIIEVLNDENFAKRLKIIAANFHNVKQERQIRDELVIRLNEGLKQKNKNISVFAEHPRVYLNDDVNKNNGKGSRVTYDMSFVNKRLVVEDKPGSGCYKIELKYQFSNDSYFKSKENLDKFIKEAFIEREADLFILIVNHSERDRKTNIDNEWGISSNLQRYMSKETKSNGDYKWAKNIKNWIADYPQIASESVQDKISVDIPCESEYRFFIIRCE